MGPLFACVVMAASILFGLVLAIRELRRRLRVRAMVEDTPLRTVAELAPGVVAVEGRAVSSEALTSPLGGVTCLAYRSEVERRQEHSRRDQEWVDWRSIFHERRQAPLSIEDATGRVPIELGMDQLGLGPTAAGELSPSAPEPTDGTPAARALRLAQGDRRLGLRWEEACLVHGEPLFVVGSWSEGSIRPTEVAPVVASKLGRQGAVRTCTAGVRRKLLECAVLVFMLVFFALGTAAGIAELARS